MSDDGQLGQQQAETGREPRLYGEHDMSSSSSSGSGSIVDGKAAGSSAEEDARRVSEDGEETTGRRSSESRRLSDGVVDRDGGTDANVDDSSPAGLPSVNAEVPQLDDDTDTAAAPSPSNTLAPVDGGASVRSSQASGSTDENGFRNSNALSGSTSFTSVRTSDGALQDDETHGAAAPAVKVAEEDVSPLSTPARTSVVLPDAKPNAGEQQQRPFSLATPETPSSFQSADSPGGRAASRPASTASSRGASAGQQWRDSVASTSAMESVALSESAPGSEPLSPTSGQGSIRVPSVALADLEIDPEAGPSTPSLASAGFGGVSPALPPRRPLQPRQSYDVEHEPSGQRNQPNHRPPLRSDPSIDNYSLISQHAQSLHDELEQHPKRKRRSQMGSADLRASFLKLREEAEGSEAGGQLLLREESNEGDESAAQAVAEGEVDWDFWGLVMSDYEGMAKTRPKELSKAIQNGIPPALRGMMWQLMSASKDPELEAVYSNLMRQSSPHEKAIIRDLNRTFPTHEYFHDGAGVGQNNLLNIMKAYSLYDEEVGYCQGMAFVVGPLLLNMPDEEAFCVLVRLMKSYDLRSQYIPDMPGLQLRLFQFDRLLEELLPAVFMHLLRQGIKSSMYASQWFLTLLAYRFPLELVSAVFDLIFAEGVEAIFRFALALMKRNEQSIIQMEFEQVLEFLKTGLFEHYKMELQEGESAKENGEDTYSAQAFVREALQIKITPMMLDQFASEWAEMLRQQNAQNAEVEQLRSINKKLSNQVRHLESSLAQINQEHCELVKQVVATRLEKEELEDELVRVKMALAQESLLREEGRGSIASRSSYSSFGGYGGPSTPGGKEDRRDSQASKLSNK